MKIKGRGYHPGLFSKENFYCILSSFLKEKYLISPAFTGVNHEKKNNPSHDPGGGSFIPEL